MKMKFYICPVCGQIMAVVKETGVPVVCCGVKMKEIIPGTADASFEKHVPAVKVNDGVVTVNVGSQDHPMTEDHYIEWVALKTRKGNQRKCLAPGAKPEVCFRICGDDEVEAVYAYCNIHSLWEKVLK